VEKKTMNERKRMNERRYEGVDLIPKALEYGAAEKQIPGTRRYYSAVYGMYVLYRMGVSKVDTMKHDSTCAP
jgi:hypothetical protein